MPGLPEPYRRHETLIDFPFVGVFWPILMGLNQSGRKRLKEIEQHRQTEESGEARLVTHDFLSIRAVVEHGTAMWLIYL